MASIDIWNKLGDAIVLPKGFKNGGVANTPNYNPQQSDQAIAAPDTDQHLRDLLQERIQEADGDLIKILAIYDPDVSAAFSAYMTLSNTTMRYVVRTVEGEIDSAANKMLAQLMTSLTNTIDYSLGFTTPRSLRTRNSDLRYMIMMRGSIALEMILDAKMGLTDVRNIDTNTLEWYEKKPGRLTPVQKSDNDEKDLNIPTFFYAAHRKDPTSAYSKSMFISVINTVYARLQIINDLYDIMQMTGYPRVTIKVLEDTIVKNMTPEDKLVPEKRSQFVNSVISSITSKFSNINPTQPLVHTDGLELGVLSTKQGGGSQSQIDIRPVIEVLNAQNQSALKSVATVLGRGASGVNTASVESQIFSMQAGEINEPIADVWSQLLTFALRLSGSTSFVEVYFDKPEMRPPNELEPAMIQKQTRLQKDLSLGLISDEEYHLQMYNRPKPENAPILSGTGFYASITKGEDTAATSNTPQADQPDSRQRAQTRASDNNAKSNAVK